MHESFKCYVDGLHPAFERLLAMKPVSIATLPKDTPASGIYLFSEAGRHLYVGRTKRQSLRKRMNQHSSASAQHNQAVFAFKLARQATGKIIASYSGNGTRKALLKDAAFALAFAGAKQRIRTMELRYVAETDSLRQTLLEIYVAKVLNTPYNDFDTH